jgi:hypothetical protein
MKDSLDFKGEMIMERRAQDYLLDSNGYVNAQLKDYSFLVGAGSVFSTASDVYKFGEAVLDGKYGENSKADLIGKLQLALAEAPTDTALILKSNAIKNMDMFCFPISQPVHSI